MAEARLCKLSVKDTFGRVTECETELSGNNSCSNRVNHISPMKTGFCDSGWHEGTTAKSYSGANAPTCKFWKTCPCDCHKQFDQLFIIGERAREAVDNSGYMPDYGSFVMPSYEDRVKLHSSATFVESEAPEIVPATVVKTFTPTQTGRTQKGELEAWVKDVCDAWLIDEDKNLCTPPYVASEVARRQGIKTPSSGAVDAVWVRWAKLGFAVIEKKPTRFVSYTEDGIKLTLQGMKDRARRKQAST